MPLHVGRHTVRAALVFPLLLAIESRVEAQVCTHQWSNVFTGAHFEFTGPSAFLQFAGELYVGGSFTLCMGRDSFGVARWNGFRWFAFNPGISRVRGESSVYALIEYTEPNHSPTVYAASAIGVHKWNGAQWIRVALTDGPVTALTAFQEPGQTYPALFAAGEFTCIRTPDPNNPNAPCDPNDPNQVRYHIARWLGGTTGWEAVSGGTLPADLTGAVYALSVFNAGPGEALYAGGKFTQAGAAGANRVAKWDGTSWSPVGVGIGNGQVSALTPWRVLLQPSGQWRDALYAGGTFTEAGGTTARKLAAAYRDPNDGAWTWTALGDGITAGSWVSCLAPDSAADALYVGGRFSEVAYVSASNVARWDGEGWLPLGMGLDSDVQGLTIFDDGTGPALYAGGAFTRAGDVYVDRIARWRNGRWSPLGNAPNYFVFSILGLNAWDGPAIYMGGDFNAVGELNTGPLARWDGHSWLALGPSLAPPVNALIGYDDGDGLLLYAGGGPMEHPLTLWGPNTPGSGHIFRGQVVQGQPPDPLEWVWSSPSITTDDAVCAFAIYPPLPDTAATLYAAGEFRVLDDDPNVPDPNEPNFDPADPDPNDTGDVYAPYIARWNAGVWEAVTGYAGGPIHALAVADLGDGPALYTGSGSYIHKFKNGGWSAPVLSAVTRIEALAAYDDGSGEALFVGGQDAPYLKKWDGTGWYDLSAGGTPNNDVLALHVYDDGRGPALYASGIHPVNDYHLARWGQVAGVGLTWEGLGYGTGDHTFALGSGYDGLSDWPALYAGGHGWNAGTAIVGDTDSQHIARWGCPTACRGDLNDDGDADFGDINPFVLALTNPAGYAALYPGLAEVDAGWHYTAGLVLFFGDLDCDGSVGFGDINPFIQRLIERCCDPNCGTCPLQGGGENALAAGSDDDTTAPSPTLMAAMLAANVQPAYYDALLALVAMNAAHQAAEQEAAYWEAVYRALVE